MQKIKISVVIPAYNESATIGECLSALLRQSVPADEIIVVDNNSTDGTAALVRRYYPGVKVLRESRQGIIYARTHGFNAAKGNVIARIDADTQVSAAWISHLHGVFADPNITAVGGKVWYYDRPFQRISFWIDGLIRRSFRWSAKHNMLQGCNMALRRSAWHSVKGTVCSNTKVHEDMDLGLHLWKRGYKIVYDPSLLAGISARRLDTSLKDFSHYIRRHTHTYWVHGTAGVLGALCLCAVILVVWGINGIYSLLIKCRNVTRSLTAWR